jgi:hypothetical protein
MTTEHLTETAVLSANPVQALQDMMKTLDNLRAVYEEETRALRLSDIKAFFALQNKKIAAAQEYHAGIAELVNRKDELLIVHPDMKSLFNRKHDEFSAVAHDNIEALDRMRRTVDRLGNRMVRAARDSAARDSVSYSAHGHLTGSRNKPVTMGMNESA